jgi:hypothetical protein
MRCRGGYKKNTHWQQSKKITLNTKPKQWYAYKPFPLQYFWNVKNILKVTHKLQLMQLKQYTFL